MIDPFRELSRRILSLERRLNARNHPQLAHSSIEDGAIHGYVDDQQTMVVGSQFDGTNGAYPLVGPQPARPTAPHVEIIGTRIKVTWDGNYDATKDDEGNDYVPISGMDFSRVDIAVSTDPSFNPIGTPPAESINTARGGSRLLELAPNTTYYVALIAWSVAGKYSPSSTIIPATTANIDQSGSKVDGGLATCTGSDALNADPLTWENFPDTARFSINVPDWASYCYVWGYLSNVTVNHDGHGALRMLLADDGQTTGITHIGADGAMGSASFPVGGGFAVPAELRGSNRDIFLQGRVSDESSQGFLVNSDGKTTFEAVLIFTGSQQSGSGILQEAEAYADAVSAAARDAAEAYADDLLSEVSVEPFEYQMPTSQTTAQFDHTLGHDPVAVQVIAGGQVVRGYTVTFPIPGSRVLVGFDTPVAAKIRLL